MKRGEYEKEILKIQKMDSGRNHQYNMMVTNLFLAYTLSGRTRLCSLHIHGTLYVEGFKTLLKEAETKETSQPALRAALMEVRELKKILSRETFREIMGLIYYKMGLEEKKEEERSRYEKDTLDFIRFLLNDIEGRR